MEILERYNYRMTGVWSWILMKKAGGASGYLPGGIGWYRKSFMIPASYKNQKVSLVFDGIYHKATIFFEWKGDCLSSLWIYFV